MKYLNLWVVVMLLTVAGCSTDTLTSVQEGEATLDAPMRVPRFSHCQKPPK